MLKNQKGVTLVALVVIIVLLIVIVTVAISFAFGNNGWGSSSNDYESYAANTDYKIDTFMNETEVKLQEIEANVSAQQEVVTETTNSTLDENQSNVLNDVNEVVEDIQ